MNFSEYRFLFKRLRVLASLLVLGGCTSAGLAALNLPSRFNDGQIVTDVSYGTGAGDKLDIYIPANSADKKLDVVVFFYGGRWSSGAKEDYRFAGTAFSDRGFITVIPDYRKYPVVKFPTFVEDSAKAVSWVYDHIDAYGGDPHRIHLAGHSAGAHIGALIAADSHYLAALGKKRSDVIQDFAGLAGPYSFTPDEPDLMDMFGPPGNYPKMQVTTFIDGTQPPMLLLRGDKDTTVKRENLDKLQAKIHEKGGCGRSIIYTDIDHVDILVALSWAGKRGADVADDIAKFFREPKSRTCGQG
jgi:acetyl esterase/lipase